MMVSMMGKLQKPSSGIPKQTRGPKTDPLVRAASSETASGSTAFAKSSWDAFDEYNASRNPTSKTNQRDVSGRCPGSTALILL